MKRAERQRLASETDAIVATGGYEADGRVDLSGMVAAARDGTHLHLPDEPLAVAEFEATGEAASSAGSETQTMPRISQSQPSDMVVEVTRETTLEAAHRLHGDLSIAGGGTGGERVEVACLNFASAKHPGGGYRSGAQAQEESLARASALVACLEQVPAFYDFHHRQNHPIYSDQVVCSPGVPVFRDDDGRLLPEPYPVTFLTVAAPNAGALQQRGWQGDLESALQQRAERVLAVSAAHRYSRLVLGAWGCGVFRNDPSTVAGVFAQLLNTQFAAAFAQVTFAIYDPQPRAPTFRAFQDALMPSAG